MRRPATVSLGLFLLAGCSSDPPPIQQAKKVSATPQGQAFVVPTDPPPAVTDPASKAIIEAALKAHTDGQPAKLCYMSHG